MKNKFIILLISFVTLTLILSCSEDSTTEPPSTNTIETPAARLSDIQVKVFNVTCALSGCHSATNNQAGLLLTDGNSYNELVNVQGEVFTNFTRVIPDSSSQSLIIKLIKGELSPRMPLDRDPLPAAVIDSIAKWIDDGALNN